MGHNAVSNSIVAVLVAVALMAGAGGYYALSFRGGRTVSTTEYRTTTALTTVTGSVVTSSGHAVTVEAATVFHRPRGVSPSTLVVFNGGTSSISVNEAFLTYSGQTCSPEVVGAPVLLAVGVNVTIAMTTGTCTAGSFAGVDFTGTLFLSNSGQVPFSGTFS